MEALRKGGPTVQTYRLQWSLRITACVDVHNYLVIYQRKMFHVLKRKNFIWTPVANISESDWAKK